MRVELTRNSANIAGRPSLAYLRVLAFANELGTRPLVAHCHVGFGKLHAGLLQLLSRSGVAVGRGWYALNALHEDVIFRQDRALVGENAACSVSAFRTRGAAQLENAVTVDRPDPLLIE